MKYVAIVFPALKGRAIMGREPKPYIRNLTFKQSNIQTIELSVLPAAAFVAVQVCDATGAGPEF